MNCVKMCVINLPCGVYCVLLACLIGCQLQSVASQGPANNPSLVSNLKYKYIKIDHELEPRLFKNINDMTPLPVPPGRDSEMRKYPVKERNIQEVIQEIDKRNQRKSSQAFPALTQNGNIKNETEKRTGKVKSVLGTEGVIFYDADWGLMSAILTCYNNHWALRTGPEDWWTVVLRRLVSAMEDHGEIPQVRNFFVEHEGKKKIEVIVGASLSNIDYNWLFSQFADKIKGNIKEPYFVDIIENDFSSSTAEHTLISNIMLMSSLKNYFEFGFGTACGIPGIEMKGTEEDWMRLMDKFNKLESLLMPINKYLNLTNWFKTSRKIFTNLLKTYRGNPDREWWGHILSWNQMYGSGARSFWTGWFPEFVGAMDRPGEHFHFPSDMVTVPIQIKDLNNHPPVQEEGGLVAGIVGFNVEQGVKDVEQGGRTPVVEPQHAWSLLLPENSRIADRLTGKFTAAVPNIATPINIPNLDDVNLRG